MYTKYNYMYKSTIEIFVIVSYSYTSMYTKYNYMNMSTIETLLLNHTLIQACILNIENIFHY